MRGFLFAVDHHGVDAGMDSLHRCGIAFGIVVVGGPLCSYLDSFESFGHCRGYRDDGWASS